MLRRSFTSVQIRPRRAWMAAAFAAVSIAACDGGILPLPEEGPPQEMEFSFGGFAIDSRSIEVRGDTVVLRRRSFTGTPLDSVRTVPTAEAWREFREQAERAGVSRWDRRYMNEDVADGAGWGLRIVNAGWVLQSEGSNAYPDRRGGEHHEPTAEFEAFMDALGDLAGQPLFLTP